MIASGSAMDTSFGSGCRRPQRQPRQGGAELPSAPRFRGSAAWIPVTSRGMPPVHTPAFLHPSPHVLQAHVPAQPVEDFPPHHINALRHCLIQCPVDRASPPTSPEQPGPPCRTTESALPAPVGVMLAQQHQHSGQQSHGPLFKNNLVLRLLAGEPINPLLKLFPQEPVSRPPDVAHSSQ